MCVFANKKQPPAYASCPGVSQRAECCLLERSSHKVLPGSHITIQVDKHTDSLKGSFISRERRRETWADQLKVASPYVFSLLWIPSICSAC